MKTVGNLRGKLTSSDILKYDLLDNIIHWGTYLTGLTVVVRARSRKSAA